MPGDKPMVALLAEKLAAATEGAEAAGPEAAEPAEAEAPDASMPSAQIAERSAMANVDTAIAEGVGVGKAMRDLVRICIRKYGSK
jgi:hypothetical protein